MSAELARRDRERHLPRCSRARVSPSGTASACWWKGARAGGKSTLASLLVGLRKPDSGLLLLNGLDRNTLGALLQDAQLTILDESFAALDPETLQKCLRISQR